MLGTVLLTALTLIWGTSFPLIKTVVSVVGASPYVYLRFALATAALAPYAAYRLARGGSEFVHALLPGTALGAAYFAGIWLQGLGMEYTTATNAGFITSLHVPMVYAADALVFGSRHGPTFLASATLSILGLWLISGGMSGVNPGDLIVLAGAAAWAVHVLAVARFASSHRALDLVFAQYAVTSLLSGAMMGFKANLGAAGRVTLELLYLALACSVLAGILQVVGQRYTTPSEAALIYTLEPVFAAAFSHLLLGESLAGARLFGAALILAAVATASWDMARGESSTH